MGRRAKQQKFKFVDDEDELQGVKAAASKSTNSATSDDDEANEDLSLKIVEKAMRLRSGKLLSGADDNKGSNCQQSGNVEDADAGTGTSGAGDIAAASAVRELGSKKTVKKRKRKVKKVDTGELDVVVTEGEKIETIGTVDQVDLVEPNSSEAIVVLDQVDSVEPNAAEAIGVLDQVDSLEPKSTETTDNNVFRKLLRGPRYFDPPDSWGTCYNCGEEGHNAVKCTSVKRKRPCFVCGSLEHNAKSCSKVRDCYICKKGGHRAKDCPEKHMNLYSSSNICLRCGDPGHDMFSCQNLYPDDDLKNIQCYICKKLGHLCCANSTSDTSIHISCYKCGQTGHTGLACSRLRGEASSAVSPSQCYRCGEEGHFARECTSSTKSGKRNREEASGAVTPSPCYRCGEEGHFARECTISTKLAQGGKRNREEASGAATPSPCFRCGEEGHFARECTISTKLAQGGKRNLEEASGAATPSSCYRCGGEGHFARECTSSTKGGKRNRDLSTPKLRSQMEETNHMGSKSASQNHAKAHNKMKKIDHEEKYTNFPRKSGQKGRWMMEDPGSGNFSNGTFTRNNWNSPDTPSRWGHNYYTECNGQYRSPQFSGHYASPPFSGHYASSQSSGHFASPQSYTNRHSIHPGTPMSIAPQNRFSASRFGDYSNEGRRKSHGWW